MKPPKFQHPLWYTGIGSIASSYTQADAPTRREGTLYPSFAYYHDRRSSTQSVVFVYMDTHLIFYTLVCSLCLYRVRDDEFYRCQALAQYNTKEGGQSGVAMT